ncbi:NUDIX domain-containing protein [Clostridium sp. SYSU_GA19001]|uniref:NUDIX hydrolase n=1 Tax=Clostridium caldaquaticum TaxID=2940653 RepID=UPI0020775E71|nr:NUDIX domain-containing protein [Clostridium caldaquaticum]MCM8710252.1 NUDIX domain-containing protein [Clostridium caldaquaticum]
MCEEYFDIYNERMEHIGTELRSVVHKKGYWHKSFQCWFVFKENNKDYILLQRRHPEKDTYPNHLDITSAGHLSAGEEVKEGIRELKEELGVHVSFENLIPLGVIKEQKSEESFIDNEFANVFLFNCNIPMESFKIQAEEVTGMFKISLKHIIELFEGSADYVRAEGYEVNDEGCKIPLSFDAAIKDFVPHDLKYYKKIFHEAREFLSKEL